jgi:hypothetical protein
VVNGNIIRRVMAAEDCIRCIVPAPEGRVLLSSECNCGELEGEVAAQRIGVEWDALK